MENTSCTTIEYVETYRVKEDDVGKRRNARQQAITDEYSADIPNMPRGFGTGITTLAPRNEFH